MKRHLEDESSITGSGGDDVREAAHAKRCKENQQDHIHLMSTSECAGQQETHANGLPPDVCERFLRLYSSPSKCSPVFLFSERCNFALRF